MDTGYRILLFRGRGIISRVIRFRTRSEYSHVAILTPGLMIIEAWQRAGVRTRTLASLGDTDRIEAFSVPSMTLEQWKDCHEWMLGKVGLKYDYGNVLRFLLRTEPRADERWFCSELVFAGLVHSGTELLRSLASLVSPHDISLSPLIEPTPLP